MPRYDYRTLRAIRAVTPREIRFFGVLNAIRTSLDLARLFSRSRAETGEAWPILSIGRHGGFVLLADDEREIVLGKVDQFWKPEGSPPPRLATAREFAAFDEPDYAKAVINFHVEDQGRGVCRVTTQTRVLATDEGARRRFGVYWRTLCAGSALIRKMWLSAIRRRAEGSREDVCEGEQNGRRSATRAPRARSVARRARGKRRRLPPPRRRGAGL
jgi:hypothetical protein